MCRFYLIFCDNFSFSLFFYFTLSCCRFWSHLLWFISQNGVHDNATKQLEPARRGVTKKDRCLPTTPSLPSCMKPPLASMDEVDSAETAIQSKEIFDATVSILGLFTLLLMYMFKLHAC